MDIHSNCIAGGFAVAKPEDPGNGTKKKKKP
jgi:hypothetical protein